MDGREPPPPLLPTEEELLALLGEGVGALGGRGVVNRVLGHGDLIRLEDVAGAATAGVLGSAARSSYDSACPLLAGNGVSLGGGRGGGGR